MSDFLNVEHETSSTQGVNGISAVAEEPKYEGTRQRMSFMLCDLGSISENQPEKGVAAVKSLNLADLINFLVGAHNKVYQGHEPTVPTSCLDTDMHVAHA